MRFLPPLRVARRDHDRALLDLYRAEAALAADPHNGRKGDTLDRAHDVEEGARLRLMHALARRHPEATQ